MSARLQDYRMLWRAAVTQANPRLSAVTRWGTSTLALLTGVAVGFNDGPRAALVFFWCAASMFLLLDWAWRFMPGAVRLNTPAYAALVPQMRRRLVELSCLVCFVGLAGIASAPYADTGSLGGWLFWVVVFIVGVGLGVAGHPAGGPIVTAACFGTVFVDRLPAALDAALSHPLAVLLALPVYAGVIVAAVRAMFPQGGERHWDMLARRARWDKAAGKRDPLLEEVGGNTSRRWYCASLRRDSARRDGRRLVLHALGPAQHVAEFVAALGLMMLVALCLGLFAAWRVDRAAISGLGWLFACMVLVIPLIHAVRLGQLAGSRGEQALVRLAPSMPAGAAAFNTQLGRSLVRQALAGWLLACGAALLLAALSSAGGDGLLGAASLCCLILPVVAVPLRNHASRAGHPAIVAAGLLLASISVSVAIGYAAAALASLPVLPVAALASVACAAIVVTRRLRLVESAPCAFPAGRMD